MTTTSLWQAITPQTFSFSTLNQDIEVDVAIIGGGITGITAALELIKSGKTVAIFEADKIGGMTTRYSTGNLYIAVQPYYHTIVKKFDETTAKVVAHARKAAIDYIEENVNNNDVTCGFSRRPTYYFTQEDDQVDELQNEVETLKKLNIDINYTTDFPLNLATKKAAIMPNQARMNPYAYVVNTANYLQTKGVLIFENTKIVDFVEHDAYCELRSENQQKITAKKLFIATHSPIGINITQLLMAPYRSYVVAVHLQNQQYPEGHFWDFQKPHMISSTHSMSGGQPDVFLVADNHHKTGQNPQEEPFKKLEEYLHRKFSVSEILYKWSAQHFQSADAIPYIGLAHRKAKHTYIATGYFADGLVYGTLAGLVISDSIIRQNNPLIEYFSSQRFTPAASASFVLKENTNVLWQYLKDMPTAKQDFQNIKIGEGKVVEINREKCAVSRDENNQLKIVSAVCTHMKCVVNWNTTEKTWDCPCHGSRFSPDGKVLEGPAIADLTKKGE